MKLKFTHRIHNTNVHIPQSTSLSTIIRIPKNRRKCLNDSSNYRGIAVGSLHVLGKVLYNILYFKRVTCNLE